MVYIVKYADENILETDEINKAITLYTEKYLDIFNQSNKDFKSKISYINFILNIIEKDDIDNDDIKAYYYYEYNNSMIIKITESGMIIKTNITTYLLYDIFNEFYSIVNEYSASLKTYQILKDENTNIQNIPDFFKDKYEAISMMDENDQLEDEDNKYLYYEYYYLLKYGTDTSDLDSLESEELVEDSDEVSFMEYEQSNIPLQKKINIIEKSEDEFNIDEQNIFINSDDFIKEELISIIEHLMNNNYMNKHYIQDIIKEVYISSNKQNNTFWDNLIEINQKKHRLDKYKKKNYNLMLQSVKDKIEIKSEFLEYPENIIELCYLNNLLDDELVEKYELYFSKKKYYNMIHQKIELELESLINQNYKTVLFRKHLFITEHHILYKLYHNGLLRNKQHYYDTLTYYFESDDGGYDLYKLMFNQDTISNNKILNRNNMNDPKLLETVSVEQIYFKFDCLIKNINYTIDTFDINIFNQIHKKYMHKDKDLNYIHKFIFDYFKRKRLLTDNNLIKMFNEIYNFIVNEILTTNYSLDSSF